MRAPADVFARANAEFLAGGKTSYQRIRTSCLKLLRICREVPDWKTNPTIQTVIKREQTTLAVARATRDTFRD